MVQPEYIDFGPAIDAVGNNPAKMGTALIFNQHYPEAVGSTLLAKEFVAVQGDEPGWELGRNSRSVPFSYCKLVIAPTFLDETRINAMKGSGTAKAYHLNQRGLNECVPLSGAGLGWELDYSDTSTIFLLGSSNSYSRTDRMPSLRIRLYELLLGAPNGKSKYELYRGVGETAARAAELVPSLSDAGIIEASERYDPRRRRLSLRSPDFAQLKRAGPHVSPEVVAIYGVAKTLVNNDIAELSGQEFLDSVHTEYPQLDPKTVWLKVRTSSNGKLQFLNIVLFEGEPGQRTSYIIAPEYEDPIAALVRSYRKLETSASYRKEMSAQAEDIINDPDSMAELFGKAYYFSHYTNGEVEDQPADGEEPGSRWQTIATSIPAEGTDTRSLYKLIVPKDDPVTFAHFRRMLKIHDGEGYHIIWGKGRGIMRRKIEAVKRRQP